ncbi:unnamed protein product, partial [Rotaria magnacalcarata]
QDQSDIYPLLKRIESPMIVAVGAGGRFGV